MKVKLHGVEFRTGSQVPLGVFLDHLVENPIKGYEFGGFKRFVYVQSKDGYYSGLVITTKDIRQFIELMEKDGEIEINSRDVSPNSELAEFNFFIVNSKTGRGLYQHYYHSCALNTLGFMFRKKFAEFSKSICNKELEAAKKEKDKKAIKEKYNDTFDWNYICKKENFEKLLINMARVKSFDFTVATLNVDEPSLTPLSGMASRVSQSYGFDKQSSLSSVVSAIKKAVAGKLFDKAKLVGEDQYGEQQVIYLEDNLEVFAEFEFDEIAEKMKSLHPQDFNDSWFMKKMQSTYKSKLPFFSTPIKD